MSKLSRRILAMLLAFAIMASMGISALAVDSEDIVSSSPGISNSTPDLDPDSSDDSMTTLQGTSESSNPTTTPPDVTSDDTETDETLTSTDLSLQNEEDRITNEIDTYVFPSNTTYGYFYVRIPGTEDDLSLHYTEAWIYAGRQDIGSNPSSDESTILETDPITLEGIQQDNTLGFPYPTITIEGTEYSYDPDLSASNTYKIVWDALVDSFGANWPIYNQNNGGTMPSYSATEEYIVLGSTSCWHIDGHIETIGPIATVKFQVNDDPEKSEWIASTEYYRAETTVSNVVHPSNSVVPDTKTVDGLNYIFDGWYTDTTYTTRIDDIGSEEIGEIGRTFYGRYLPEYTVAFVYTGANDTQTGHKYAWNPENAVVLPKGPQQNSDSTANKYFAGWYNEHSNALYTVSGSSDNQYASGYNHSVAPTVEWTSDSDDAYTMTFYAVYYTENAEALTPSDSRIVPETDITSWQFGQVEDIFGTPQIAAIGGSSYIMAAFDPADTALQDYQEVGLVISVSEHEIAHAPTVQGGYQSFSDARVFCQSIRVDNISYSIPTEDNGDDAHHYIMFRFSAASDIKTETLYVTPYAITNDGVYIYGMPGIVTYVN